MEEIIKIIASCIIGITTSCIISYLIDKWYNASKSINDIESIEGVDHATAVKRYKERRKGK